MAWSRPASQAPPSCDRTCCRCKTCRRSQSASAGLSNGYLGGSQRSALDVGQLLRDLAVADAEQVHAAHVPFVVRVAPRVAPADNRAVTGRERFLRVEAGGW